MDVRAVLRKRAKERDEEIKGRAMRRYPRDEDDKRHAKLMQLLDKIPVEKLREIKVPDSISLRLDVRAG